MSGSWPAAGTNLQAEALRTGHRRAAGRAACLLLSSAMLLLAVACPRARPPATLPTSPDHVVQARSGGEPTGPVVLLFSAEVQGYTEPCGCTAELQEGGIGRLATLVRQSRAEASAVLLVDGGDLLTQELPVSPGRLAQEEARRDVLLRTAAALGYDALVPGELDLALLAGLEPLAAAAARHGLRLLTSNLRPRSARNPATPRLLLDAGPLRIGLLGLTDPALLLPGSTGEQVDAETLTAPLLAARVKALRDAGATHVVVVGHAERRTARRLLAEVAGIDFWLMAHGSRDLPQPEAVGSAWLLEVWNQGRRIGRLDLYPAKDPAAALRPSRAPEEVAALAASIRRRAAYLERTLGRWPAGQAPPEQVELLARARAELAALEGSPPPGTAGTFRWRLLPLGPEIVPAPDVDAWRIDFNARLAELQRKAAAEEQALLAAPGQQSFSGSQSCASCHEPEHRQWSGTPHARALQHLVERGKQFDDQCVSCHVTGYRQPGGAWPGHIGELADVGCESCHGPASLHASAPDEAEMPPAAVPAARCLTCHNERHSPRFTYEAYLPAVLGPGHGQGVVSLPGR